MKECIGKKIIDIKTVEEYREDPYFNLLLEDGSVIFVSASFDSDDGFCRQNASVVTGEDAKVLGAKFSWANVKLTHSK